MAVDWKYPEPRKGIHGIIDRFIGPGATRDELLLQFIIAPIGAISALLFALHVAEELTMLQMVFCFVFAFDLIGGIITNATSTAKRWYHRSGQCFCKHFMFIALHLVHLALFSLVFLNFNLYWLIISGSYLVFSGIILLSCSHYLQRPLSLIFYVGSLIVSLYILHQVRGMEWFLFLFYLKLQVSHLPKEEPYRPATTNK